MFAIKDIKSDNDNHKFREEMRKSFFEYLLQVIDRYRHPHIFRHEIEHCAYELLALRGQPEMTSKDALRELARYRLENGKMLRLIRCGRASQSIEYHMASTEQHLEAAIKAIPLPERRNKSYQATCGIYAAVWRFLRIDISPSDVLRLYDRLQIPETKIISHSAVERHLSPANRKKIRDNIQTEIEAGREAERAAEEARNKKEREANAHAQNEKNRIITQTEGRAQILALFTTIEGADPQAAAALDNFLSEILPDNE